MPNTERDLRARLELTSDDRSWEHLCPSRAPDDKKV